MIVHSKPHYQLHRMKLCQQSQQNQRNSAKKEHLQMKVPSNESMAEIIPINEDSLTTSLNILPETVLIESEDSEPETSSDIWIKLDNRRSRGGITLYEINKHCLFDG